MKSEVELLDEASERFHQQWSTGEWEGPGQLNWLTSRYPCGQRDTPGTGRACPCRHGGRGRRGLPPWSQVLAAPGPFDRWFQ